LNLQLSLYFILCLSLLYLWFSLSESVPFSAISLTFFEWICDFSFTSIGKSRCISICALLGILICNFLLYLNLQLSLYLIKSVIFCVNLRFSLISICRSANVSLYF
jgi:hypothetical protein